MFDEDPNFTGSRMHYVAHEVVKSAVAFRISVQQVDNFTDGKITRTYYDWAVEFRGERIATRNPHSTRPRTPNAAVWQAKKAIRDWCSFIFSSLNTR